MIDWETFKAQLQTNPSKMLKSVLLLAGCLLIIWLLVVLQSNPAGYERIHIQDSGRLDSLQTSTSAASATSDSLQPPTSKGETTTAASLQRDRSPGYSGILPSVLLFLMVLGGVWFWVRKKRDAENKTNGALFTTIASQQLPGGQYLVVTELNREYWVMATGGPQGITLLHRYSSEEWHGINEQPEKKDWRNTFLKTLHSSSSTKKQTG